MVERWGHGNAAEHIYDNIYGSLEQATFSGIKYGELISTVIGNFILLCQYDELKTIVLILKQNCIEMV
jgi:hypothetical protein